MTHKIVNIFPTPIYVAKRETEATTSELEDIKSIIEKASVPTGYIISSRKDTHIFDTKLNSLKEFCELHINIYVNEIISPKNTELDFYITQSWSNYLGTNFQHHNHSHPNSIVSGVFYVQTDGTPIEFYRGSTHFQVGNFLLHLRFSENNGWNSDSVHFDSEAGKTFLFPSSLYHAVSKNLSDIERISISFNTFVKGDLGRAEAFTRLVL